MSLPSLPRCLTVALSCALLAPAAAGQWSADAAANLVVADGAQEQAQPKIAPTADGGCYVSWFDNDPAGSPAFGYDVRLQLLDREGVEQWAHGGVLVADRGFSSTQDYDLAVDAGGNALLAFRDDRFVGVQITATRVDATGAQTWGATGVQLTDTVEFVASPKITGTSDGESVVAWLEGTDLRLQRLSTTGVEQWVSDTVLTPAVGVQFSPAALHAGDAGSAIVGMVNETGGFGAPRHLYAQKLDASGALLWGAEHLAIFTGGSLQFGNFPGFVPDGSGGAVFGWYSSSPALECRAQRVLADGTRLFDANGVTPSNDATKLRVSPGVAFDPATSSTYLVYTELNSTQSQSGLSAQRFDAAGFRQWGATGKVVQALSTAEVGEARALAIPGGGWLFWTSAPSFGMDQVLATRVGTAGNTVLAPFPASSTRASKFRLQAAPGALGFAQLAWQDDGAGSFDIASQNVNVNGTLGTQLAVDVDTISLAAGGTQTFTMDAGPANAGMIHWIIGSATGTSPALTGPPPVPLVPDDYMLFLIVNPNTIVQNALGFLDGAGQDTAFLPLGAGALDSSFAGLVLYHANIVIDGNLDPILASNAVSLTFVL